MYTIDSLIWILFATCHHVTGRGESILTLGGEGGIEPMRAHSMLSPCMEQVTAFEEVTSQICRCGHCSLWSPISRSAKAKCDAPSCETMKIISLYLLFCMAEIRSFVLWRTSVANVSKQIQYGHLKDKGTVKEFPDLYGCLTTVTWRTSQCTGHVSRRYQIRNECRM
jgi:hypothetical protein